MINHYTASRKRRNDDAYSPGGRIGLRPDRPTPVYAQRCREAFPGVPVVIGGIEASLRRIAHFDYWTETVRPSMLVPSKADLLAFGKGEETIVAIAERLARRRERARTCATCAASRTCSGEGGAARAAGDLGLADARAAGLRRSRRRQARVREDDADLPPGDEPVQRAPSRPGAGRPEGRPQPALPAARRGADGRDLRPAVRAPSAPALRRADPGVRDDPGLDRDHARLLRGLHLLQHHDARGARHPEPQPAVDPRGGRDGRRRPGLQGDDQRPRRAHGQHVPDALHAPGGRGGLPAALVHPPEDLHPARHRPRPDDRPDARGPRRSRA